APLVYTRAKLHGQQGSIVLRRPEVPSNAAPARRTADSHTERLREHLRTSVAFPRIYTLSVHASGAARRVRLLARANGDAGLDRATNVDPTAYREAAGGRQVFLHVG